MTVPAVRSGGTVRTLQSLDSTVMMLPTHVLGGLALALPLAWAAPDLAPAIYASAVAGSVLPDIDMYAGHRRTLHFPVYYPLGAVPAAALAVWLQSPVAVGVSVALVAAAVHCRMDELGGSLELRPWEHSSERGVYDHYRGDWRAPRRWIRYDGSPRDLVVAVALGGPLLVLLAGQLRWLVAASLAVGTTYVLLRKRLATATEWLVECLPAIISEYVPGRYRDG